MITKERLEAKRKVRHYETIKIGEDTYRLQSLLESEKADYEYSLQSKKPGKNDAERLRATRVALLVRVLVDAEGNRILENSDEALLADIDGREIGLLADAALKLCGYTKQDEEDLAKKSV